MMLNLHLYLKMDLYAYIKNGLTDRCFSSLEAVADCLEI